MTEESYVVKLTDVFEGPMDLLVHLIQKHEVDIYDIPIGLITDQYLAYIQFMQALNIDLAGDFLVMAATLAQIKSKCLLPVHDDEEELGEDPRDAIAKPLAEYLEMKAAAEKLAQRHMLGEDTFVRKTRKDEYVGPGSQRVIQVGLFELIDAFQKIVDRLDAGQRFDFTPDRISVKDKINEIVDVLEEKGSVTFVSLFAGGCDKAELIVTFLAVLEMVKMALVRVVQHVETGIIRLFYL